MSKNTGTRKASKYLKTRGIDTVLHECGNNLKVFIKHVRITCKLPKDVKLQYIREQAKEVLKDRLKEYGAVAIAVEEFLERNFGYDE